ncbi:DUF1727 domain-containing protein [Candidatus Daviesbacteria bacterium]|nr:DUF1727 domain-containing protein [Candidatus Daviesbacteria bacterium]
MLKTFAALLLGKSIFFLSRLLGLGGGFAAPGFYALKIDPDLVNKLASQIPKQVIITGTNGKTTTSAMLAHMYRDHNQKVIRNQTGSNLERGIASTLIKHSSFFGSIREQVAVWEIDEAAFNNLAPKIKPDLIVFLNVFRDQLDRYGEVDSIIKKWIETIMKLPEKTQLLINGDDGSLEPLEKAGKKTESFSVHKNDFKGEKKSSSSKNSRFKTVNVKANALEGTGFIFQLDNCKLPVSLQLPGDYNIYNASAALAAKFLLGDLRNSEAESLKNFKATFGRFENFESANKRGSIFLIKNPVGATQVLQTVLPHITSKDTLLLALNDNLADGRDVSWIWDIELEKFKISNFKSQIFTAGSRAFDLALRLKYAGIAENRIEIIPGLESAFDKSLAKTSGRLFILPTYTALMKLQKIMVKKGIRKEYWKE